MAKNEPDINFTYKCEDLTPNMTKKDKAQFIHRTHTP